MEAPGPFWAPSAQCRGRESSTVGPMPLEELRLWLWLPSTGPLSAPCLGFPASPLGLGTQVVPVSLAPSPQRSGTPFPCEALPGSGLPSGSCAMA